MAKELDLYLDKVIENRDPVTTWIRIYSRGGDYLGHTDMSLRDMICMIKNLIENNPEMDTSDVEEGIESIKELIYKAR
jgi:hypothetical protein